MHDQSATARSLHVGWSMTSLGFAGDLLKAIRPEPIVVEDFKCALRQD